MSNETAEIRKRVDQFPYWYHTFELAPGVVTPGINDSVQMLHALELPENCKGLRALDIGTRDGFFAFELERRGASVLAIDHVPSTATGFHIAKDVLASGVEYQVANLYDLSPERFGKFDIVLFLGVLYHLRNPILALDKIRSVCTNRLWVESHVLDNCFITATGNLVPLGQFGEELASSNILQFYPADELSKDHTNWWAPTAACVRAMLRACNFEVIKSSVNNSRGVFTCVIIEDRELNFYQKIESSTVQGEDDIMKYQAGLAAWPRKR